MNNEEKKTDFISESEEIEDVKDIKDDILRYTNNKLSYWLCLLAIVFNVANFLICYKVNSTASSSSSITNYKLGFDLLINVILIIAFFLLAEKTKAYNKKSSYYCIGFGAFQIVRIFFIPLSYYLTNVNFNNPDVSETAYGLDVGSFIWCIVLLVCSSASLIAAALINLKKCDTLNKHLKKIGAID